MRRHLFVLSLAGAIFAAGCQDAPPSILDPEPITDPEDAGLRACVTNDDCLFGEVCVGGVCQQAEEPAEDAGRTGCASDSDCVAGVEACNTESGACQLIPGMCLDIADCPSGFICVVEENRCQPATPDGGTADAGCNEGAIIPCGKSKLGECRLGEQVCANGVYGPCVGSIDPQQELCNSKDDNCNGSVDEDFDTDNDPNNCGSCGNRCSFPNATALCVGGACTMGPCAPGYYDLKNGDADGCEYACTPTNNGVEQCDLVDNDCDGEIDEGFDVDGDLVSVCQGDCNDNDPAVKPSATELCNGVDDNCNGSLDEGFDGDSDSFTRCGTVSAGGLDPLRVDCDDNDNTVFPGAAEVCNGKNDDCDAQTDEGFGQLSCGIGTCANTVNRCENGQLQSCSPLPAGTESCANLGVDDDCDGDADELTDGVFLGDACSTGQQGVCAAGTRACAAGALVCTQTTPAAADESCGNGLDDDCDGKTDENPPCTCTLGAIQPCYEAGAGCTYDATTKTYSCTGTCKAGTQTCVDVGGLPQWGSCSSAIYPAAESCANQAQDNDCDGDATELVDGVKAGAACSTGLKGVCAAGTNVCQSGAVTCSQTAASAAETCDLKDNDCDGSIDEDLGTSSCGVGACRRTVDNCINGVVQTCTEGPSSTETCNNVDDDCNGAVDDIASPTATCGVGECRRTVQRCVNGSLQSCVAGTPTAEICDGKDNNCNNSIDDVTPATLSCGLGACARTVPACSGGANNTCVPGPSVAESCNGADDDCDGTPDNNLASASCSTGKQGICAAGHTVCIGGVGTCEQDSQPSAEICGNGIDDNCAGGIDEGCGCVDVDNDGVTTCQNDCNDNDGAIKPGAQERCDGKDNDCDGQLDEGFDADSDGYTTCGTVPGGGLDPKRIDCNDNDATSNPGKTCDCATNCTISPPSGITTGQGDGKDNNCNGVIDETCGCSTQDIDKDGFSECQGDCNDGDKTVFPGAPELCDGKNNDCNAQSVENCDVGQPCGFTSNDDVCKDRLICATDIASGRQTCGSFCNFSQAGGGIGDGCRTGESCAATLVVATNDHLCTSTGTTGTKVAGDPCASDSECKSNNCYCDSPQGPNNCRVQKYCSDLCGNDAYCGSKAACVVRFVPQTSYYSFYTGTCFATALAYEGTKLTGESCTTGKSPPDCRWGDESCVNGKCAAPCCKNSDCPGTYFCNGAAKNTFVNASTGGLRVATSMPLCTPRTTAGNRVAGAACTSNADCLSQFCEKSTLGGKCVDLCCSDASCANGTTCEMVFVKKKVPVSATYPNGEYGSSMRVCVHTPLPTPPASQVSDLVWE